MLQCYKPGKVEDFLLTVGDDYWLKMMSIGKTAHLTRKRYLNMKREKGSWTSQIAKKDGATPSGEGSETTICKWGGFNYCTVLNRSAECIPTFH